MMTKKKFNSMLIVQVEFNTNRIKKVEKNLLYSCEPKKIYIREK